MFFGCWTARDDFLYRDELAAHHDKGVLINFGVAFSRERADKEYVQHLMLRRADDLWAWLQGGASVYVCGDAARMAKDVDAALGDIAKNAGGLSEDKAAEFIGDLRKHKRYLRDVY